MRAINGSYCPVTCLKLYFNLYYNIPHVGKYA